MSDGVWCSLVAVAGEGKSTLGPGDALEELGGLEARSASGASACAASASGLAMGGD